MQAMMEYLWIIGLVGAVIFFAVVETYAFDYPNSQWTLSRTIATIGSQWPLSIWICGVFAGALATHFFWHFCPFGGTGVG
jgi:uncharacterized membrane protein YeaQ/YmgE (transglycosylase-associated protein family)